MEQCPRGHLYLVRLSQAHETFRKPELETLGAILGIPINILDYRPDSPFCILRLPYQNDEKATATHVLAKDFIARSVLAKSIHELYATGTTYEELHRAINTLPAQTWEPYHEVTFKFSIDAFCGKRSTTEQREIVESFRYLPFQGGIKMNKPNEEFVVFEEWELLTTDEHSALNTGRESKPVAKGNADILPSVVGAHKPRRLFFGRFIGESRRDLIVKHDLKKRPYISTTSMDAELALVTAVLAKAGPAKLFLDPFTGTGGFMVAAAELGALTLGSDIDGRSFRGKGHGLEKGVGANFKKYGLQDRFGDCLTSDLTNTPFRILGKLDKCRTRWLDGIICDPPYGVREGLKVLGRRVHDATATNGRAIHDGPYYVDGVPSHTLPGFIAPKRPYSFNRMLDDILDFAARTLVDGGRLAFWMPCVNDADEAFPIPQHVMLELKHSCIQVFNKWSRRLLVYERTPGTMTEEPANGIQDMTPNGSSGRIADELNQFRRMYFRGFAEETAPNDHG